MRSITSGRVLTCCADALAGGYFHPVQTRGDVFVGPAACHASHDGQGLVGSAAAMLAGLWFADPQLTMLAATPMDRQDDLASRFVDISNDVGDKGTQEPLASAHADARRVPCGFEVISQPGEVRHDSGRVRDSHRFQSRLA